MALSSPAHVQRRAHRVAGGVGQRPREGPGHLVGAAQALDGDLRSCCREPVLVPLSAWISVPMMPGRTTDNG